MPKSHKIWNERHPDDRVKKGEVIHHKNGDHDDDTPSNQQKMTRSKHNVLHKTGNKYGIGNKSNTGMKHTEETKRKIGLAQIGNKSMTGMKHTEESKRKMSLAQLNRRKKERDLELKPDRLYSREEMMHLGNSNVKQNSDGSS